jgi:hypothetical protein
MVLVLVGGTLTVDICLHWSRFQRAILLKGHCLCNGKVIGLGCRDAVLNFVQSNFMENVNG